MSAAGHPDAQIDVCCWTEGLFGSFSAVFQASELMAGVGAEGSDSCRIIILPQFSDHIIMLSAYS